MRPLWFGPLLILLAGCATAPEPASAPAVPASPTSHAAGINPANIRRVGRELPPGYEVTNIARAPSPRAIWSLTADAAATPPQCMALADPAGGRDQPAQGVSGSGPGGILDAVVVPAGVALDANVVTACAHWDLTAGRTTAGIGLIDAPHIDGAQTVAMVADIRAAAESGSEIDSRAYTFVAYLGDHLAFTTLTTDPGSMLPALPPQFAADLLVKTVSTLRG
ncbi:hypothetical protein A5634_06055 [Mycobacterium asiaticum]|uniref:DUF5642 domain-containing protein n=1 Tax=Mycobacterium asiaticum TaxID=1790 RepID=A0A1A3NLT3_MYCAS|nr:hypothetical protein A5634_06055 [Mycobacterium asiaticum]